MRLMRQFGIIAGMTCVGELMHYFIPLPVPGSIYGLALMMIALMTGMIKLESVLETSQFLIDAMPLMFIPAGVGLMTAWGQLRTIILPVTVVTFVSTVLVMGITGRVTEILLAVTARGRAKGETASQELKEEVLAEENIIAEELREAAKNQASVARRGDQERRAGSNGLRRTDRVCRSGRDRENRTRCRRGNGSAREEKEEASWAWMRP